MCVNVKWKALTKCFLWVNEASCKALGMLRLSRKAVYKNETIYTFMSRKKITQVIPNIIPADMMLHCYFVLKPGILLGDVIC